MAFGLDQTGKQAADELIAQIPGLETFTASQLDGLKVWVPTVLDNAGSVIQADLQPIVTQLADFNANVRELTSLLTRIYADGIRIGGTGK